MQFLLSMDHGTKTENLYEASLCYHKAGRSHAAGAIDVGVVSRRKPGIHGHGKDMRAVPATDSSFLFLRSSNFLEADRRESNTSNAGSIANSKNRAENLTPNPSPM